MTQFVRFLMVGAFNTGIGLCIIYLAMWRFGVEYRYANAIGYAAGIGLSFVLNRSWTFEHRGSWRSGLARWLAVVAVAYGLNIAIVVALHQDLWMNAYAAQLGGIVAYTASSFFAARFFVFRQSRFALPTGSA